MPVKPFRVALVPHAIAATLMVLGGSVQAQSITAQQFLQACATNPGNTVVLTQQTKFQVGWTSAPLHTATGCTVVLAEGASFELDNTIMSFGGAFVVQGGAKAKVSLDKSTLSAASVTLSLTGFEGQLQMNEARLASAGNMALQFGEKGMLEIKNSGRWYQPRLSSLGVLTLTAGDYFNGTVVASGLQGAMGVSFAFNGVDSALKLENSDVLVARSPTDPAPYTSGPFQVTGSAPKASVEAINVSLLQAGRNVTVALNGMESKLSLKGFVSQTISQRIALTTMGAKGEIKVENVLLQGNPEVIIESGAQGSTYVGSSPPSTIRATQLVRVRAGLGGSCSASAQGLSAPTVQVCN
jgi:hypothetical protein